MHDSSSTRTPLGFDCARLDIFPLGDRALVIEVADEVSEASVDLVSRIDRTLAGARLSGVRDLVPAFCSLTLYYDPRLVERPGSEEENTLPFDVLRRQIEVLLQDIPADIGYARRLVEIPVCYGGDCGEDLAPLALARGMSAEEFIALHTAPTYFVGMLGFLPGFPYLGGLDPRLFCPRRATPRARVLAGSVAIGGQHSGIYPFPSPGGWHVIGRTPVVLFDLQREPISLLAMGDRVRFVSITREAYDGYAERSR
ncbi:MAG TPA: 5-oxoprolinase subunit PxpB [Burkholderiales bacterium]|nr:5-oxoprolinase subunit PxpB [Burkholderiales bacterium]